MPPKIGKVYLVGGGPGDPGLMTLRGCECLARADVVLYDYLVNPRILAHARAGAQLVCLGRHGGDRSRDRIMPQAEINQQLVELARAGRSVVRLKGGDPMVFAHAAEEIEALAAAGIPYEIVPGITAALAAGSYAGIPITHGGGASAVAFVTGQEREDKQSQALDFRALAAFPGTLVFYMGVTAAEQWTTALVAGGKSAQTPAAIVRRCSWPDQQVIACTLETVAQQLHEHAMRPPVVVIVGDAASRAGAHDWFTARPLFGVRVLVTRPAEQTEPLLRHLTELGADVLVQSAIEIAPPEDWGPLDRALAQLPTYDWLVFASANGVQYFLERLWQQHLDVRSLGHLKLAAIGRSSAEALAQYHLRADVVPDEFRAEALAEALSKEAAGRRFLLARASRGREILAEQLQAAGGAVDQVVVYSSRDVTQPEGDVARALAEGKIDWVMVSSSAIARSLVSLFGQELRKSKLASISPVTSATLRELGFEPAAEARQYTIAGLVEAICMAQPQSQPR
jgi:uroporphyrinogen III methyltransferase/synthase